jgi:hypothetical protein
MTDRSTPMVFMGYEKGTKGYRVYDPVAKKLHITRDVVFEEHRAWNWGEGIEKAMSDRVIEVEQFTIARQGTVTDSTQSDSEDLGGQSVGAPVPSSPMAVASDQWSFNDSPAASAGLSTPPSTLSAPHFQFATPPTDGTMDSEGNALRYRTLQDLNDSTEEVHGFEYSGVCFIATEEPRSVDEALTEECWREAMRSEMESIQSNQTWELAVLPRGHRAIGLKWVFKVKKDLEGRVIKHKARLVAKGYAQREGVDFEEVFAPVARIETVRLLLALAVRHGWKVHHMDVKSAFLNGDLVEEVYVQKPPGFVVEKGDGKVLKLKKLYMAYIRHLEPGMQGLIRSY